MPQNQFALLKNTVWAVGPRVPRMSKRGLLLAHQLSLAQLEDTIKDHGDAILGPAMVAWLESVAALITNHGDDNHQQVPHE